MQLSARHIYWQVNNLDPQTSSPVASETNKDK